MNILFGFVVAAISLILIYFFVKRIVKHELEDLRNSILEDMKKAKENDNAVQK